MARNIVSGFFIIFFPFFTLAQTQSASIITRTGNITPPLKYHFDLSSSLTEGVNQGVRVAVSASNPEKTAIRFDSVRLFGKDGSPLGNNVASKTDALTPNPYSFIFQNFGIAPKDLVNVGGVQITFMDMGGENPTGKILVHGITVSVIRDTGESCIEIDPITITTPEKPRVTINQIQAARPLVQPGTHGDGGGSCGQTTDTYSTAGSFTWTAPTGVTMARVQVWGAGGGGSSASGDIGAGGGAYSEKISQAVTAGTGYTVLVGAGGTSGVAGGDSYFANSLTVLAKGGDKGGSGFGMGGQWAGGVGEIRYSGGNGGGTGGGSSAGTASNGTNGAGSGGGLAPTGGGNGGNGGVSGDDNGSPGSAPGGGGGSGAIGAGSVGGTGGAGKVLITYMPSGCGASVYDSFMDLIRTLIRKIS